MSTRAPTFRDSLTLTKLSPTEFTSKYPPQRLGNVNNIAYGGCALSVGIYAAYQTVKPGYHAYSTVGNYLGPALVDRVFRVVVRPIRDTRTFATRVVEVLQDYEGGPRACMYIVVDFQTQEPATVLNFSAAPTLPPCPPESCITPRDMGARLVEEGKLSAEGLQMRNKTFSLMDDYFELRGLPSSVGTQNLYSMVPSVVTTQDHLPLAEKVTAEWARCRHALETEGEQVAALAFYMDAALAFMPLAHDHKTMLDVSACSSLDFALRIMPNSLDCNKWHLREIKAIHGGEGRTYTEGRLWDEHRNLVASMTQQSILRPKKPTKAVL